MAHWFHRNPYKATASQKFDVSKICLKNDFLNVVYNLRDAREGLLKLLVLVSTTPENIEQASEKYFGLVQGLFEVPNQPQQPQQEQPPTNENKSDNDKKADPPKTEDQKVPAGAAQSLNSFFRFKWTQSLHVNKPALVENNAKFDFINMAVNVGLWYSKYAARLAAKEEIGMEDAKMIHTCLRKAAGIFKEIKDNQLSLLTNPPEKTSDLDPSILEAYVLSSQAEAQEVTIARAVEKKHSAKLIAGLANETAKLFQQADDSLKTREQLVVMKWRKYLQLKQAFYSSFATCYYGVSLLDTEKCGESVRVLQDSTGYMDRATKLCAEYKTAKGAGSTIRPNEHPFYVNFKKDLQRRFEKSSSENGFIYHQKVPPVAPALDFQATHGLVEPVAFTIAPKSSAWTASAYAGFSITKNVQKKKVLQKDTPVTPIKEPDIQVTKQGCVIS